MNPNSERRVMTFDHWAWHLEEATNVVDEMYRDWQAEQEQPIVIHQEQLSHHVVTDYEDEGPRHYLALLVIYSVVERT